MAQGLIGAAAIALFASLFLPWFEPGYCPPGAYCALVYRPDVTGWEAFRYADILLAAASLAAVALTAIANRLRLRLLYLGVALIGWAAIALAMFAVGRPADPDAVGAPTQFGYLLALLGGGGISLGGLWAGLFTDGQSA